MLPTGHAGGAVLEQCHELPHEGRSGTADASSSLLVPRGPAGPPRRFARWPLPGDTRAGLAPTRRAAVCRWSKAGAGARMQDFFPYCIHTGCRAPPIGPPSGGDCARKAGTGAEAIACKNRCPQWAAAPQDLRLTLLAKSREAGRGGSRPGQGALRGGRQRSMHTTLRGWGPRPWGMTVLLEEDEKVEEPWPGSGSVCATHRCQPFATGTADAPPHRVRRSAGRLPLERGLARGWPAFPNLT